MDAPSSHHSSVDRAALADAAVCALAAAAAGRPPHATDPPPVSAKLRATAVSVLTGGRGAGGPADGRWAQEADAAVEALASSSAPDPAAFRDFAAHLRAAGTPCVDAFLVALQGIAAAPAVRAALVRDGRAQEAAPPPPQPPGSPLRARPAPNAAAATVPEPAKQPSLWPERKLPQVAEAAPPRPRPSPPAPPAHQPSRSPSPRRPPAAPSTPPRRPATDLFAWPDAALLTREDAAWATAGAPAWADPAWAAARPFLTGEAAALPDGGDGEGGGLHGGPAAAAAAAAPPPPPLGSLDPGAQEAAVLDDLLYAWLGCDGEYLRTAPVWAAGGLPGDGDDGAAAPAVAALEWRLVPGGDGTVDAAVAGAAARLAPLARAAASLDAFARSRSALAAGRVAHGAAAAAAAALARWRAHVAAMDAAAAGGGGLTLAGLAAASAGEAAPLLAAGAAVEAAAAAAPLGGGGEGRGAAAAAAALLDSLHASWRAERGDGAREAAVADLLAGAAAPWFAGLDAWVRGGEVADPHGEGPIVVEGGAGGRPGAARLRTDAASGRPLAPAFVPPSVLADALAAGRAVAALRRGGGGGAAVGAPPALLPPTEAVTWDPAGGYGRAVAAGAAAASGALLALALRPPPPSDAAAAAAALTLPACLAAARAYLLLGAPGFARALASGEVGDALAATPAAAATPARLAGLLSAALAAGGCGRDPAGAALRPGLDARSVLAAVKAARDADAGAGGGGGGGGSGARPLAAAAAPALRGPARDALTLALAAPWPACALFDAASPSAAYYGILFRHLHGLAAAAAGLDGAWRVLAAAARRPPTGGCATPGPPPAALARALAARAAMAAALAALTRHAQAGVLDPAWARLDGAVRGAATLDGVVGAHAATLRSAARGCLLLGRGVPALRGLAGAVEAAHAFADAVRGLEGAAGRELAAADAAGVAGAPSTPAARVARRARALAAAAADPTFGAAAAAAEAGFRERVAELVGALEGEGRGSAGGGGGGGGAEGEGLAALAEALRAAVRSSAV